MLRQRIFFNLFILLVIQLHSQNWNVFNKNYRYNYKYDYSPLITNVLFADSVIPAGNDTLYRLNRIAVECTGSCYGVSVPNSTLQVLIPNMPQFLQRSLKKYSNGLVLFFDTAKIVIDQHVSPGQTWTFDSINNVTASCLSYGLVNIFGVTDSVKNILVGSADSLTLSKSFGIIKFPKLYNQNKYYRLAGIEKTKTYDSTALYGIKVPNGWDFFNFQVGDKFCRTHNSQVTAGSSNTSFYTYAEDYTINSKTIFADGYFYNITGVKQSTSSASQSGPTYSTVTHTTLYIQANDTLAAHNLMYPGFLMKYNNALNYGKFGTDNNGTFYKHAGKGCQNYSNLTVPFDNNKAGFSDFSTSQYFPAGSGLSEIWGVGLGSVTWKLDLGGYYKQYCLTCAIKNGTLYLGTETFIGLNENKNDRYNIQMYPNPADEKVIIESEKYFNELKVYNIYGQEIVSYTNLNSKVVTLKLDDVTPGVYFATVSGDQGISRTLKIIKN